MLIDTNEKTIMISDDKSLGDIVKDAKEILGKDWEGYILKTTHINYKYIEDVARRNMREPGDH